MVKSTRFVIADVFTEKRFCGNQLAVFTGAAGLDTATMQDIAREMNYSETTFVLPPESEGDFRLRIFTPAREMPFAGHPVVGSAFVVVSEQLKEWGGAVTPVALETKVGVINVEVSTEAGHAGRTTMTQPLPKVMSGFNDISALANALAIDESGIADTVLPIEVIYNGITVMIVPAKSLEVIRSIRPKTSEFEDIAASVNAETVLIFTTETVFPASHSHSRVFAPGAGVGEDPATGSANGPLGYYLARHGLVKPNNGSFSIVSEQGFEMKRPSMLYVEVGFEADGRQVNKVLVGGDVVIAGKGELLLD